MEGGCAPGARAGVREGRREAAREGPPRAGTRRSRLLARAGCAHGPSGDERTGSPGHPRGLVAALALPRLLSPGLPQTRRGRTVGGRKALAAAAPTSAEAHRAARARLPQGARRPAGVSDLGGGLRAASRTAPPASGGPGVRRALQPPPPPRRNRGATVRAGAAPRGDGRLHPLAVLRPGPFGVDTPAPRPALARRDSSVDLSPVPRPLVPAPAGNPPL